MFYDEFAIKVFTSLDNAVNNGHIIKVCPADKIVDNTMDIVMLIIIN